MTFVFVFAIWLVFSMTSTFAADQPAKEAPPKPWNTSLSAGFNLSDGNSNNMSLSVGFVTEFKGKKNEFKLGIEANYGESEVTTDLGEKIDETTVQNGKIYSAYKRLFTKRLYGCLTAEASQDDVADVDLRFMAGPGIGYYLVKTEKSSLGVDVGASYIRTEYSDDVILTDEGMEDDTVALRVSERFEHACSKTSKAWQSVEYLPSFDDFAMYLLNAEIGLEAMLTDVLSLRFIAQDKYNSEPPVGKEESDLTIIAGLALKF